MDALFRLDQHGCDAAIPGAGRTVRCADGPPRRSLPILFLLSGRQGAAARSCGPRRGTSEDLADARSSRVDHGVYSAGHSAHSEGSAAEPR